MINQLVITQLPNCGGILKKTTVHHALSAECVTMSTGFPLDLPNGFGLESSFCLSGPFSIRRTKLQLWCVLTRGLSTVQPKFSSFPPPFTTWIFNHPSCGVNNHSGYSNRASTPTSCRGSMNSSSALILFSPFKETDHCDSLFYCTSSSFFVSFISRSHISPPAKLLINSEQLCWIKAQLNNQQIPGISTMFAEE